MAARARVCNSVKFETGWNIPWVLKIVTCTEQLRVRHKPLLLSMSPAVLFLIFLTGLCASIWVTRSYSSRPFLCTLELGYASWWLGNALTGRGRGVPHSTSERRERRTTLKLISVRAWGPFVTYWAVYPGPSCRLSRSPRWPLWGRDPFAASPQHVPAELLPTPEQSWNHHPPRRGGGGGRTHFTVSLPLEHFVSVRVCVSVRRLRITMSLLTSCSIIFVAMTIILAAGCSTSSSWMTVAASLVTNSFSRWLITILFIPGYKNREKIVQFSHLQSWPSKTIIQWRLHVRPPFYMLFVSLGRKTSQNN